MVDSNNRSSIMMFWFLFLVLCDTGHGRPRGSDPPFLDDKKPRRDLRGRLNGGRGGSAGRLALKGVAKRDAIFLSPAALPKPLSEHAATLYLGKVYISGGCDGSVQSTQWNHTIHTGSYRCSSLSGSFYSFDPLIDYGRGVYQSLADLPRPRYRHTSAAMNGRIWLLGGRDINDTLMDTVDVYDIGADFWTSLTIPNLFQTSDHATFVHKKFIYIAGGYTQDYDKKNAVYRIDTETNVIEDVQSLTVARGDVVVAQTSEYAFIAGGYHANTNGGTVCEPSNVVEQYEFATGMWTSLPSLTQPRGNGGMVDINGILLILGGEHGTTSSCRSVSHPDLATALLTLDTVQVLGRSAATWVESSSMSRLDTPHSRFASIAIQSTETIYTFGGQLPYDSSCDCLPATDNVIAYRTLYDQAKDRVLDTAPPTSAPTGLLPTGGVALTQGNDRCENAVELEVVPAGLKRFAPAFGTTMGATVDTNAPACSGIGVDQPGVWFQVVGLTQDGVMTAETCGEYSNYDIQLSVYQGSSCDNLECVAANDDSCGNKALVSWNAALGQTYFLLVHGYIDDPVGNYQVSVQVREPPNDQCAHAQGPLSPGSIVDGSTTFASVDDDFFNQKGGAPTTCGESSYGGSSVPGIWYFMFGTGKVMVADTCDDRTDYDTQLHIFTGEECTMGKGGGRSLECIQGNDNSVDCGTLTSRKSRVRWQSEVGMKYWIYVHGRSSSQGVVVSSSSNSNKGYFILTISEEE